MTSAFQKRGPMAAMGRFKASARQSGMGPSDSGKTMANVELKLHSAGLAYGLSFVCNCTVGPPCCLRPALTISQPCLEGVLRGGQDDMAAIILFAGFY